MIGKNFGIPSFGAFQSTTPQIPRSVEQENSGRATIDDSHILADGRLESILGFRTSGVFIAQPLTTSEL
jgi:hypothetical protein